MREKRQRRTTLAFIPYPAAKIERERNFCRGMRFATPRGEKRAKRGLEKRTREKKVIGLDRGRVSEDSHCRFSSNSRQKLLANLEPACLRNPPVLSVFFRLARSVRVFERSFQPVLDKERKSSVSSRKTSDPLVPRILRPFIINISTLRKGQFFAWISKGGGVF